MSPIRCARCERLVPPGHRYVTSQGLGGTFDLPCYDYEAEALAAARVFTDSITMDRIPDIAPEQYEPPESTQDQP